PLDRLVDLAEAAIDRAAAASLEEGSRESAAGGPTKHTAAAEVDGGAAALPRDSSDHAALRQIGDLLLRIADGRQDFLVCLTELRRRGAKRKALLAVRDRVTEDGELAERRRVDLLGHL